MKIKEEEEAEVAEVVEISSRDQKIISSLKEEEEAVEDITHSITSQGQQTSLELSALDVTSMAITSQNAEQI